MSSGRPRILIGTNPDGSIVLQYKPLETGNHDVNASFNENSVEGEYIQLAYSLVSQYFTCVLEEMKMPLLIHKP